MSVQIKMKTSQFLCRAVNSMPVEAEGLAFASGSRRSIKAAMLVSVLLATGCATSEQPRVEERLPVPAQSLIRPDGSVRVDTGSLEAARLWASSERAMMEDKPSIAIELIYEALELDPQNSLLWSRAAEIQLDNIEPELAEDYALRSNSWAGNNRALLYRNWLIIEHSRSMRGDLLGVRSAHKEVQVYQNK